MSSRHVSPRRPRPGHVSRARAARSSQRGPAAVSALNVFFYLTYEGNVDLARIADADLAARLKAQINNFGQMPPQLLHAAHPQRRPRPPAPVPCAPPGAHGVPCNKSHQLAAVALAMLPLDDSIIILDARRQLTAYKLGALLGGKGNSAPTPVGEAVRLPAFAPDITPSRAVVLAACSIAQVEIGSTMFLVRLRCVARRRGGDRRLWRASRGARLFRRG